MILPGYDRSGNGVGRLAEAAGEQFDRVVGLHDGDAHVVRPAGTVEVAGADECTALAGETIGELPAVTRIEPQIETAVR